MKKADNFNPGKWLVENKITFQSKLNENTLYVDSKDNFKVKHNGKMWDVEYDNHEVGDSITLSSGDEKVEGTVTKVTPDGDITIKLKSESKLNENKNLGPDDFDTFQWKDAPANPDAQLEDLENGGTVSKGEFWESDITGRDSEYTKPSYGGEDNGMWTFSWDSGELSGFVEGEDFTI